MIIFIYQATHVTFMCRMRFNKFPLDSHTCQFKVGSSNYDITRMTFANEKLDFDPDQVGESVQHTFRMSILH